MFHEDTVLEPDTRALLNSLGSSLPGFFLVGGTALAIQIGHRLSIDLDFFTLEPFDTEKMLEHLEGLNLQGEIQLDARSENTLNLSIADVKVDIIRYRYPLVRDLVQAASYQMLSIPDIAAMKLAAITNRGSKKDFFDLHFLLERFSIHEILAFYEEKFPGHDTFSVIRSLSYFEDAEDEPDPIMLTDVSWAQVQATAIQAVQSAGK